MVQQVGTGQWNFGVVGISLNKTSSTDFNWIYSLELRVKGSSSPKGTLGTDSNNKITQLTKHW